MNFREGRSRRIGVAGALAIAFLVIAYLGLSFIYAEGYGFMYELTYALLVLIAATFVFDRLFVR